MKQFFEEPDYSGLKREVEALRKKIEDLESGQVRPRVAGHITRWRRLSSRSALALAAVVVAVLLALGVLSAQNKQDPLFIDPNGNVSIGSARFSKIGINQDPFPGQKVIITADGTDIPLNVTNPANSVSWLVVSKDGNVFMNGGKVGIGTTDPGAPLQIGNRSEFKQDARIILSTAEGPNKARREWSVGVKYGADKTESPNYGFTIRDEYAGADRMVIDYATGNVGVGTPKPNAPLDVKGEIRGKPWTSQEYEWRKGNPGTQMTKADRSVCFLTLVSGYFYGGGEVVEITTNAQGYWVLGGIAEQRDVRAKARCMGAPDNSW
jgi:hypothetical protein